MRSMHFSVVRLFWLFQLLCDVVLLYDVMQNTANNFPSLFLHYSQFISKFSTQSKHHSISYSVRSSDLLHASPALYPKCLVESFIFFTNHPCFIALKSFAPTYICIKYFLVLKCIILGVVVFFFIINADLASSVFCFLSYVLLLFVVIIYYNL